MVEKMTGSKMVIEALREEGITTIFGYPGGAIMNVYDEIYKQNYFKHILNRHEQASIHAADGYARATGEVGVAIVTSGPGFTNAVTGLATAFMDSIPMVVISGQVPLSLIGTDAFQEIDAVGISRPCTKHNYLVKDVNDLPRILKEAFYLARSGRPGPVHIDIPKDVSIHEGLFDYSQEINLPTYKPTLKGNARQINKAITAIKEAKMPLFYIGGGVIHSNSYKLVREMINFTKIPSVETFQARGVAGHDNPYFYGMLGMHGTYAANMAMSETDLIISLGARFDDRVTARLDKFAVNAKVIHIDIDPSSISKLVNAHYPIVGDLKNVIEDMLPLIKENIKSENYSEWRARLDNYQSIHPLSFKDSDEILKPQWVIQEIGRILDDRAILSTDVGQHQMWTGMFYPFSFGRQLVSSGGLGTMGFGFPSAIGVAQAIKDGKLPSDKISINMTGDGSFLMNIQEFVTAAEYKIPAINIMLNNNYLGMVRQWQTFFYDKRYAETDLSFQPDFIKLAESCGAVAYRCHTKEEFQYALKDAVEKNQVALIEVIIDRMEDVLPMVPAGGTLYNMILSPEDVK